MVHFNELPKYEVIDHLNHPMSAYLQRFLNRDERLLLTELLIDDAENILQAQAAGVRIKKIFFSGAESHVPTEMMQGLSPSTCFYEIAPRTCKKIFEKEKMSRLFAIADMPKQITLDCFVNSEKDIVVLDELSITGNIGAIIRTATAFNAGGIVLLNAHPAEIYDRRIIRASRGYVFKIPIAVASTEALLQFCKKTNRKLMVMTLKGVHTIDEVAQFPNPLAIFLGSEKKGCMSELEEQSDIKAVIPMNALVESLNVSVAAGIVLYLRSLR